MPARVISCRIQLDLTDSAKGAGRVAFQGSRDEVLEDLRRVKGLGAE